MKREKMRNALQHRFLTALAIPFVASVALVGCGAAQESGNADASATDTAAPGASDVNGEGVPDVSRKPLSEAMDTLQKAGYTIQVKGEKIKDWKVPDNPKDWEVIAQNPAAGKNPEKGDLVQLAVREKGADGGGQ